MLRQTAWACGESFINEMESHWVLLYCTLITFFIGLKITVYGRNM